MKFPVRVRAMHPKFVRDYIIQPDPIGYYKLIIGTRQCPRTKAYDGELERLHIATLAADTLAFDYFEYSPDMDGVTQAQRDKWWAFHCKIKVSEIKAIDL